MRPVDLRIARPRHELLHKCFARLGTLLVLSAALLTTRVEAQMPGHQHPMAQPAPAGSTPASGSTAPSASTESAPDDHGKMSMPAGQAGMSMPMADHQMNMEFGGIPDSRNASGTAWQPDATPMHAKHFMAGNWMLMAHYNVFAGYDHQSGPRGDDQFNAINWFMLMATNRIAENEFTLRTMLSLEPATATKRGYPLLFQSGEAYHGRPLVDRQHAHDLFMELAARYRRTLPDNTVLSLYVAPSGEPALGPPAFMHRESASELPPAPITHHWLDSTHISYGVLTAGVAREKWQLEGSWFNGREPDENRWDVEHPKLDSWSGRFSYNPTAEWSAQISHGYLKSPEELRPREHVRRTTASLMYAKKLGGDSRLATTLAWGLNDAAVKSHAVMLESNWTNGRFNVFGRAEYVEKTGDELDLKPDDKKFNITQLSLGVSRELVQDRPWQLALGGSVSYGFKPGSLDALYGKHPTGYWIFLRLRPAGMMMGMGH